jgi:hypothetical protein
LAELRLLPGMTRRSFDRLQPFLTVYSQSARINPRTAPREVLLGLPGVSPQEVGFALAARTAVVDEDSNTDPPLLSGVDRFIEIADIHVAMITVTALSSGGGRFVREAVVILTGAPLHPVRLVAWRQHLDIGGEQDANQ